MVFLQIAKRMVLYLDAGLRIFSHQLAQTLLNRRPLCAQNRTANGISRCVISGWPVGAQNLFVLPAHASYGSARTQIARIRVKTLPQRLPSLKSMRQHQELGLGVCRCPDCRAGQPGVANLARVRLALDPSINNNKEFAVEPLVIPGSFHLSGGCYLRGSSPRIWQDASGDAPPQKGWSDLDTAWGGRSNARANPTPRASVSAAQESL